jgi:hypothetical protein
MRADRKAKATFRLQVDGESQSAARPPDHYRTYLSYSKQKTCSRPEKSVDNAMPLSRATAATADEIIGAWIFPPKRTPAFQAGDPGNAPQFGTKVHYSAPICPPDALCRSARDLHCTIEFANRNVFRPATDEVRGAPERHTGCARLWRGL